MTRPGRVGDAPTLAVVLSLGSEVRQFSHSGFLSHALEEGWRIIAYARSPDEDLRSQLDPRVDLRELTLTPPPFLAHELEYVLDRAHALREARGGYSGWTYTFRPAGTWKHRLLAWAERWAASVLSWMPEIAFSAITRFERSFLARAYRSAVWAERLADDGVGAVIVNVAKLKELYPLLFAAVRASIPVTVLYHTWKDVNAAGRQVHPRLQHGVWNGRMAEGLRRQNPWLDRGSVVVVGCLHFSCVGPNAPAESEARCRQILGARPNSQLVLFPASAAWMVPEEERYIQLLRDALRRGAFGDDVQIVVRVNPMDKTGRLQARLADLHPDVLVSVPDWRWDDRSNWCFQRRGDVQFYNGLLHAASVCVGVPSTVTIECAVADLPVVNIGFEPPAGVPIVGGIGKFWEADFYSDVRRTGAADLARSSEELIAMIRDALAHRARSRSRREAFLASQLGVRPAQAVGAAYDVVARRISKHLRMPPPLPVHVKD